MKVKKEVEVMTTLQRLQKTIECKALFEATKLWNVNHGEVKRFMEEKRLSLNEVDLIISGMKSNAGRDGVGSSPPAEFVEVMKQKVIDRMMMRGGAED